MNQEELVQSLIRSGVLKSKNITVALRNVDRRHFVPENLREVAYEDVALPIGEGQTISQPYTVVFMLELLGPDRGAKIMDVGYGSAWQTALLADIVGNDGRIYAIERLENLCALGQTSFSRYPSLAKQVRFYCQNATPGLAREAEEIGGFDGIIAGAELQDVPQAWREQLKIGGRLVYPRNSSIFRETKEDTDDFRLNEYPGFAFVPFVTD